MKDVDLSPLSKAWASLWGLIQPLFADHAFLTIVCAFFAVLMTISFYRFLKGISPALVGFILVLIFGMLVLHWTYTRTEPAFLKSTIDFIAPFFPSAPTYPEAGKKPAPPPKKAPPKAAPAKPAPAKS